MLVKKSRSRVMLKHAEDIFSGTQCFNQWSSVSFFLSAALSVFSVAISVLLFATTTYATDSAIDKAKERAEEIHEIAISDVIFVQEELKAHYYQNIQIIELLKDIRDLLQEQQAILVEKE